ncbi:hypothetical protein RSA11_04420 [Exiguobacterium indicum]|uniref:Uncharacterized protein n=1 Tax=Exiguobacterium indicum TaxID=296995 RepID=A0AAW3MGY5_9BACL|nr:hypothetical protein RSA11_04420 [Exiguobacterium indicum]
MFKLNDNVKTTYKNSPNHHGVITTLHSITATIRVIDCDGNEKNEIHNLHRLTLDKDGSPDIGRTPRRN